MKKQIAARSLKDLYLGTTVQFDTWHEREYFDTVTGTLRDVCREGTEVLVTLSEVKDRRVYTSERCAPENHEYPFPMHYLIPLGTRVHIELEEIKE